jgi:hypothetical protein
MQGIELFSTLVDHDSSAMTTEIPENIYEIAAQLKILTSKLQDTTKQEERRALLKQFRKLLAKADKIALRGT